LVREPVNRGLKHLVNDSVIHPRQDLSHQHPVMATEQARKPYRPQRLSTTQFSPRFPGVGSHSIVRRQPGYRNFRCLEQARCSSNPNTYGRPLKRSRLGVVSAAGTSRRPTRRLWSQFPSAPAGTNARLSGFVRRACAEGPAVTRKRASHDGGGRGGRSPSPGLPCLAPTRPAP
jgi:hypothetical protein